jgi:hypothetical protein
MMSDKHPKTPRPSDKGLVEDPGIVTPEDDDLLKGDNSVEGDVANDLNRQSGVNPRHVGRTSR